jgi:hypothetical protein
MQEFYESERRAITTFSAIAGFSASLFLAIIISASGVKHPIAFIIPGPFFFLIATCIQKRLQADADKSNAELDASVKALGGRIVDEIIAKSLRD